MGKYTLSDIFKGNFPVTQYFGANPAYYAQFGLAGHEGVDWGTDNGTDILAPFDGVVLRNDWQNDYKNYGKVVVVWDPVQKCAVWFCHLSIEYVGNGQSVKKRQILGKTGSTGNSTGPHLHFNFCATDAYGNRLNTDNGFLGFLNCLDPNLVTWQLGGSTPDASEIVRQAEESARKTESLVVSALKSGDPQAKAKLATTKDICKSTIQKIEA